MSVSGGRGFIKLTVAKNFAGLMSGDDIEHVAISFKQIRQVTVVASLTLLKIVG